MKKVQAVTGDWRGGGESVPEKLKGRDGSQRSNWLKKKAIYQVFVTRGITLELLQNILILYTQAQGKRSD